MRLKQLPANSPSDFFQNWMQVRRLEEFWEIKGFRPRQFPKILKPVQMRHFWNKSI